MHPARVGKSSSEITVLKIRQLIAEMGTLTKIYREIRDPRSPVSQSQSHKVRRKRYIRIKIGEWPPHGQVNHRLVHVRIAITISGPGYKFIRTKALVIKRYENID